MAGRPPSLYSHDSFSRLGSEGQPSRDITAANDSLSGHFVDASSYQPPQSSSSRDRRRSTTSSPPLAAANAAAPPLKIKRKRGALACLDCRARKRKCDGRPYGAPDDFTPEDPTSGKLRNGVKEGWGPCRQCLESSIACRWPERDKRRRQDDSDGGEQAAGRGSRRVTSGESDTAQEIKRARTSGVEALLAASRAQSPVAAPSPPGGQQQQQQQQPPSMTLHSAVNSAFSQDLQDFFATLEQNPNAATHVPPPSGVRFEHHPPPPPPPPPSHGAPPPVSGPLSLHLPPADSPTAFSKSSDGTGDIRLSYEYLRPYGPTAINPGLGRVKLSIRTKRGSVAAQQPTATMSALSLPLELPLVDPATHLPSLHVRSSLLDAFYRHFGSIFPFSQRATIEAKLRAAPDGRTALLVNSMCALSARFCDHPDVVATSDLPFCRGTQFADTAKRLLTPLLEMPSPDACAALLYLAYYGLGVNSEAAEWMYAGMALRMATDLGLQRRVAMRGRSSRSHDKLLFWSIFCLDRYLSIGVGRPSHVPDHHIDTPEPDPEHDPEATPAFAAVVRLARIQGRIADLVNASPHWLGSLATESGRNSRRPSPDRGESHHGHTHVDRKATTPIGDPSFREELEQLSRLEAEIIHAYECLPAELRWSAKTFAEHVHAGQGEIFLCLHLWYYNTIALLYREPFLHARAEYAQLSLSEATEIQKSAVRYIQEITVTIPSEHVAVLYNNPFINTCYYVAACCWISDLVEHSSSATGARAMNGDNGAASAGHPFARARSLLATTAHSNFTACVKVLRNFSQLWLGVGWIAAALAKRSQGLSLQDVIKAGVTDTILSEAEMRMISGTSGEDGASITPQSGDILNLPTIDWTNVPDFGAMAPQASTMHQVGIDQSLWGAQGLFDEDMHALFMSINQQAA